MNDGLPEGAVASSIETDQVNLGHKDRKFVLVPAVHPFRRLLASANPFAQWPIIVLRKSRKLPDRCGGAARSMNPSVFISHEWQDESDYAEAVALIDATFPGGWNNLSVPRDKAISFS